MLIHLLRADMEADGVFSARAEMRLMKMSMFIQWGEQASGLLDPPPVPQIVTTAD